MSWQELCEQAYNLSVRDRLALIDAIVRSVQNELEYFPSLPTETLTQLRGIAKQQGIASTDEELQTDYVNYLTDKYQ